MPAEAKSDMMPLLCEVGHDKRVCEADTPTHREIFSESYQINPKSDCIYHAPIDLDPNQS